MPSYVSPNGISSGPPQQAAPTQNKAQTPSSPNSLKSGPQVLIKNVNGKVTITPVPGIGASPVTDNDLHKNSSSNIKKPSNPPNSTVNGKKSPPQMRHVKDVQKSHSVPNVNGHVHQEVVSRNDNGSGATNSVSRSGQSSDFKKDASLEDQVKRFSLNDGDDPGKTKSATFK